MASSILCLYLYLYLVLYLGLYPGLADPVIRRVYLGICDGAAAAAAGARTDLLGGPGPRHSRHHHLLLRHGEDGATSEVLPEVSLHLTRKLAK